MSPIAWTRSPVHHTWQTACTCWRCVGLPWLRWIHSAVIIVRLCLCGKAAWRRARHIMSQQLMRRALHSQASMHITRQMPNSRGVAGQDIALPARSETLTEMISGICLGRHLISKRPRVYVYLEVRYGTTLLANTPSSWHAVSPSRARLDAYAIWNPGPPETLNPVCSSDASMGENQTSGSRILDKAALLPAFALYDVRPTAKTCPKHNS